MADSDHFPSVFLSFWFAATVQSSASPQRGVSPPVPGTGDKWCLLPTFPSSPSRVTPKSVLRCTAIPSLALNGLWGILPPVWMVS